MRIEQVGEFESVATGRCILTQRIYRTAPFPTRGILAWQNGDLIQDALPDLPAEDREFLVSGISPNGWDELPEEPED